MTGFLEITDTNSNKYLLNIHNIVEVREISESVVDIVYRDIAYTNIIHAKESFDSVKEKINNASIFYLEHKC